MGSRTLGSAPNAAAARRGSHFSDKQIFHAVRDGRAISATLPDGRTHTGWVYGGDDYHWGLVTPEGGTMLLHKSVPCIEILQSMTLGTQPDWVQEVVGELVEPFRNYVMREHFSQKNPATT